MASHRQVDLQVLVCTANLGNAQPDVPSLETWIPSDGQCSQVLTVPQKYPVRFHHNHETPGTEMHPFEAGEFQDQKFDLIVVGMQEATFDRPSMKRKKSNVSASSESPAHQRSTSSVPSSTGDDAISEENELGEPGDYATGMNRDEGEITPDSFRTDEDLETSSRRKGVSLSSLSNATVLKPLKGAVRNVSGLTASKDHTKKDKRKKHVRNSTVTDDALKNSNHNHNESERSPTKNDWDFGTSTLHQMLEARLPSYSRRVSYQRGEMRLIIMVHEKWAEDEIAVLNVRAQNTGFGGLANKGGIVAELLVLDRTRLAFCTAHLEAHEGKQKYATRCSTLADILNGTRSGGPHSTRLHDVSLASHFTFFMGDLNFRTELPESEYSDEQDHKQKVRDMVAARDWEGLNRIDELHRALRHKDCLVGFQTLFCNFPPTFKMERRPGYSYIDKRRPSYTDRILWKTGHELQRRIRPLAYESVDDFASSDHKPVRGAFTIQCNRPLRMRARLARQREAMNLSGMLKRSRLRVSRGSHTRYNPSVAHKNKLYVFVSGLKCQLHDRSDVGGSSHGKRSSTGNAPSTYVLLVSFPEEAIKEAVSLWQKVRTRFGLGTRTSMTKADGSRSRSAFGWPRSSLKRNTLEPDWGDEEIQCLVKTHNNDGSAIDLTGSMLRITVVDDAKQFLESDPVIGSVPFNLENLLRKCITSDGNDSTHHSSRDELRKNSSRRQTMRTSAARRGSILNVFRRKSALGLGSSAAKGPADDDDDDPIVSAEVDEPLMKNGREVGHLQCTIEAWWMNQDTARNAAAVSSMAQPQAGGSPSLLTARHSLPSKTPKRRFGSYDGNTSAAAAAVR